MTSATIPIPVGSRQAFNQPQPITDLTQCFTAHVIHQSPHQVNAAATDAQFPRLKLRHLQKVKRGPLIQQRNFDRIVGDPALNLERPIGPVAVSVSDDIADRFARGENDSLNNGVLNVTSVAHSLDKCANHGNHSRLGRNS
jgi:hypothetical protein